MSLQKELYIYIWSLFTTTTPIPPPPPQKNPQNSKFTFLLPCFDKEKFALLIIKTFLFLHSTESYPSNAPK